MASTRTGGSSSRSGDDDALGSGELVERLRDELVDGPQLRPRVGGARLEAREVEKVLDEPLQPSVLGANRLEERAAIVVRQRELAALEAVERLLDRRERRSQVVRDGLDHGRLDGVASPQCLGLERLPRERLALQRHAEQRREGGEQSALRAERRLLVLGREENADRPALDGERVG